MSVAAKSVREHRVGRLSLVAAFVRRDWGIAVSYKLPFIFDQVQSIFSLLLVYFLAKIVNGAPSLAGAGGKAGYFGYAVVGLTLLNVLSVALITFSDRLRTDQTTGTLEAVLATPTPSWLAILASASYELLYAAVSAAVLLLAAVGIFGLRFNVDLGGVALAIVALLVSVVAFASLGVGYAAFVMVFKKGSNFLNLAGGGLALFSGVYFPTALLPGPIRLLARALPLTQGITVMRSILLAGQYPWGQIGILAVTGAVLLPISLFLLDRAVNRARRGGTLGQY
jgi:ABC-2 type transport system permease protein